MPQNSSMKKVLISSIICLIITLLLFVPKHTYADGGSGGSGDMPGGGGDGTPTYDCTSDAYYGYTSYGLGRCNLWIRVSINQFTSIWNDSNRVIGTGYSPSAANVCMDTSKNTDGWVIIAGHTNPKGRTGPVLWNAPSSNSISQWKANWHNKAYDYKEGKRWDFLSGATTSDGRTYGALMQDVMNSTGLTERELAFFCMGMSIITTHEDSTINITSTSAATVTSATNSRTVDGTAYNTVSSNTTSASVQFRHTLTSTPTGYANKSKYTKINTTTIGEEDITDTPSSYTSTKSFNLSPGEKKEVCQTAYFTPTWLTLTKTYKNGVYDSEAITNSGGSSSSRACTKIARERSVTFTSETTVDRVTDSTRSGHASDGTDLYILPLGTSSSTITFHHKITSNPSGYENFASYNSIDSETVTNARDITRDITVNLSNGESKKICQTANGSPQSITILDGMASPISKSGTISSSKCITIYRMAEAVTSVKSYIKSTVNGGTTTENPQESSIIARRDDTPKETHVGTSTRIYADSSSQDKTISLNFIHTVFRGNNNSRNDLETYDLRNVSSKTVKIPWSVTGTSGTDTGTGTFESSSIPGSREVKSSTFSVKNGKNSESSSTNRISLGTFNKEICQTLSSSGTVNITYPSSNSTNNTTADGIASKACAHLYRPYNFDLYPTTTIDNAAATNSVGEEMSIDWRVENKTNSVPNQEGTHSYSPENTKVRVIGFVVSRELSDNNVGDKLNGGDFSYDNTCNFYKDKLGAYFKTGECAIIKEENFTNGILISGANGSTQNYIPNHLDVGDKVCYATAVNYIDSNYNPTGNGLGYGTMNSGRWRISNASCKSTAKRPNFRVLGGSIYGSGNVSGAITKIRNEHDGSYDVFGSWVDFGIVSNGNISYVASGASLAEGHDITNENIPYTCEENNPLSVANKNCNNGTGSGRAGIFFNSTTIDRIVSHYSGNILAKNQQAFSGNVNLSTDFVKFTDKYYTTVGDAVTVNELGHETFYRYTYIDGNASISASDSLGNGVTHIIYATGHITIKSNLTYSSGNLDDSVSIPQYIIIADGGIEISNNVDRVNAWLISPNSTINTCAEHTVAGGNSSITLIGNACEKQLRINGPVFAKTILLNRTFGAEPADPSVSAEIFDMSATTFFWGYTQARDYAKAETVYTRELAPRY